jgi:predicted DNA-binding transcriptional regulator AlpA
MDNDTPTAWTVADAARYLGTTHAGIRQLIGDDPTFPQPRWLGPRRPRWSPEAIPEWLAAGGTTTRPARTRHTRNRRIIERV